MRENVPSREPLPGSREAARPTRQLLHRGHLKLRARRLRSRWPQTAACNELQLRRNAGDHGVVRLDASRPLRLAVHTPLALGCIVNLKSTGHGARKQSVITRSVYWNQMTIVLICIDDVTPPT